jgi:ABC transporter DrrB family efflux protein
MAETAISQPRTTTSNAPSSPFEAFMKNLHDVGVMTRRNLLYYLRVPQLLVFSSIQPVMFLLLFTYVFGGSIENTPLLMNTGIDYINYLLPGILVQTVLFGGQATAVGLSEDLSKGLIDRFRSLPMARSAVLAGRTVADTIRHALVMTLMIVVGFFIGFEFANGIVPTTLALLLILAFGHAGSWIFAYIGMLVKDPETAQVAGFVWIFPLVFASSIFVPTDTMPELLRIFAENQPVSVITIAARELMTFDGDISSTFFEAVAWVLAIWGVFAALAIRQYRRSAN